MLQTVPNQDTIRCKQQMNQTEPFFSAGYVLTAVESMIIFLQSHEGNHQLDDRHMATSETLIVDLEPLVDELQTTHEQGQRVRFEVW